MNPLTFLTGLWGKALPYLIGAAVIALALLALVSKLLGAGKAAEKAEQAKRDMDARRKGDEVERRVDAADPVERERLRNKWTRG